MRLIIVLRLTQKYLIYKMTYTRMLSNYDILDRYNELNHSTGRTRRKQDWSTLNLFCIFANAGNVTLYSYSYSKSYNI